MYVYLDLFGLVTGMITTLLNIQEIVKCLDLVCYELCLKRKVTSYIAYQ